MKRATVAAELSEIADQYPTLRGLMNKRLKSGDYLGNLWADTLADLDPEHFSNVCHEYATLERQLPSPADQLPFDIKAEVKRRVSEDDRKLKNYEIQAQGRRIPGKHDWDTPSNNQLFVNCMRIAISPHIKMTEEEAMELAAYGGKGAERPVWLDERLGQEKS